MTARRDRAFAFALAGIAFAALGVRVAYILTDRLDFRPLGDAYFYQHGANLLAQGKGFISPFFYPRRVPAAEHPPLYLLYLAIPSVLGMKSVLTHMLWSCALGTGTVMVTGMLGRAVGGAFVGLGAAIVAALYPNMWLPDGALQAESLAMFLSVLAVFLAYRALTTRTWQHVAAAGVVCGLAALARSELVLLGVFLVLPLALTCAPSSPRERARFVAIGLSAIVLVIAPWAVYNTTRFRHPVVLSTQFGPLLSSANCFETYHGVLRGYFDQKCTAAVEAAAGVNSRLDESQVDIIDRHAAWKYITQHLNDVPGVESVRLMRIIGAYPHQSIQIDAIVEAREEWGARSALYSLWPLEVFALLGALVLFAEGRRVFPLLAPIGVTVVIVFVAYASARFRAAAEPSIAVLAVLGLQALVGRFVPGASTGAHRRDAEEDREHADDGPDRFAGHERAADEPNPLAEPDHADDAQQHTDDDERTHQA